MAPLVEEGMKAIQSRTNVSTGLAHPNDKNAAKEMFLHLHNAGEILTAAEISSWAQAHGWRDKDAEELGAIAQQIGMSKKPRIEDGSWWKPEILDVLKSRIA